MMSEYGKATPNEKTRIIDLEKKLGAKEATAEDTMDQAALYIYPCHRECEAIELFERVLNKYPDNCFAVLMFSSYSAMHYIHCFDVPPPSNQALTRAKQLLESLIYSEDKLTAGAYKLLPEMLEEFELKCKTADKIMWLEKSVALKPG